MFRSILLTLLFTSALAKPCCLCWVGDECWGPPMERNGLTLNSQGQTCGALDLATAYRFDETHPTCQEALKHEQACCDLNFTPTPVQVPEAERPLTNPYGIGRGPETICDVCTGESGNNLDWKTFTYPTTLYVIWAVLYIPGNPDCQELFWRGALGYVPNRLCYPLSLNIRGPCGCSSSSNNTPTNGGNNAPELTAAPVPETIAPVYGTPPPTRPQLSDEEQWKKQIQEKSGTDELKNKLKSSFTAGRSWSQYVGKRRRRGLKGSTAE